MNTIFTLESLMNKIETTIFSVMLGIAIGLSIFGAITENIEALKSADELELSKNKREVEIANDYYIPENTKSYYNA